MTPEEVQDKTKELYEELQRLKRIKIGIGNYQQVMAAYQKVLGELINCVHELAEDVQYAVLPKT